MNATTNFAINARSDSTVLAQPHDVREIERKTTSTDSAFSVNSNLILGQAPLTQPETIGPTEFGVPSFLQQPGTAVTKSSSTVSNRVASLLLAEWHGQVTEILENSFVAQLKGRHGEGVAGKNEEAIIPFDDVRTSDKYLVEAGAFFSLCVSYEVSPGGTRRRFTEVVFRRMPSYRREELEYARERGRELARGLRLE